MLEQSFPTQPAPNWKEDPKLAQVEVIVGTEGYVLTGYTYRLHPQRLLDALNKGFSASEVHISKDFVPLTETKVYYSDGKQEYMATAYIRKTNILFVAERLREGNLSEHVDGAQSKIHVRRPKKPMGVKAYMPMYSLLGKMHGEMWQQLLYVLNKDDLFLPLTDVEISPELMGHESRFAFVAINRDKVIHIVESP
jgi:hypothetical protein